MKKLIAGTLVAMIFHVFSPTMPLAHAGILQDQLMQVVGQDANVVRVQQLLAVKKQLESGNKQELLDTLAKVALANISSNGTISNIASAVIQGDTSQVAENVLRQEIQKRITDKIAPYEKELQILATLFAKQPALTKVTADPKVGITPPLHYKRIMDMTATAYAPGPLDNGKWNTQTYVGGVVQHGIVAVDPKVIPMGTKLWVEGYGEAIANDQGSAIQGNRIDLAFNTRGEAQEYGIKNVKIYVLD